MSINKLRIWMSFKNYKVFLFLLLSIGLSTGPLSEEIDDLFVIFTNDNQEDYKISSTKLEEANELLFLASEKLNQASNEYDQTILLTQLKEEELNITNNELIEYKTIYEDSVANYNLAQTDMEAAIEIFQAVQNNLTSSSEEISKAQTELEITTEKLLTAEIELSSSNESLSNIEEIYNSLKVDYDESISLLNDKEILMRDEEMIVSDVIKIVDLAQNEFDLVELEFNETLNILQNLDSDQIDSLIKSTKNIASEELIINIDSSDLKVIFEDNYGSKEIKAFTNAYEKEARFLIQAAKFEAEGKTQQAENMMAKAQKEKEKFLEKAIKPSEKEVKKEAKKAEKPAKTEKPAKAEKPAKTEKPKKSK